jgi:hypothetical protein
MKRFLLFTFLGVFTAFTAIAQQAQIKGTVKDAASGEPIPNATVTLENTNVSVQTDGFGVFVLSDDLPMGEHMLMLTKQGYITARYPVIINAGETLDLEELLMDIDVSDTPDVFSIVLSDDELNTDTSGADNISGLLSSSQDVFARTAAFEFSSSFFRVRGLDSDNGSVLINGIEMNKMFNGRPQWSNWGGLNDVVRNQELTTGLTPSAYNFGGILGTTNINVRASQYREGGRVTYSSSNRSYTNRVMAYYASGLMENGWAFTLSVGRRWGDEGFVDATLYDSNSFFASVEKKINEQHSINFTGVYAPNRRGKSSPNTQEIYDLKGIRYNDYWGYQDGEKRNSRERRTEEPIFMLNHYWNLSDNTTLNTNVALQFGENGNSRIDFPGGANPTPSYYQNLPSYFLADDDGPDYAGAYIAEQEFLNDGQVDWNRLYDANITNNINGLNAAYVLYEDRNDDTQFTANTILNSEINDHITLNASLNYRKLKSENFAEITDLLGSTTGLLNVDGFDGYQFDANNPDAIAFEGDKFRYNYNMFADVVSGYAQGVFKYNKVDFYLSASVTNTQYQREGLYDHEAYDNSFGKSRKLTFTGFGAKGGVTYKLTGKHLLDLNAGYITRAPSLRNTFSNSRENNNVVGDFSGIDITEEKILSVDASYIYRSPIVKAKLTGFYTTIQDANEISFFFADGLGGGNTAFVQEVVQGIDKLHFGGELGIEAQVTSTLKLKGVASVGQFTYNNNPNVVLTSDDFLLINNTNQLAQNGAINYGESNLKDYKIANGPQKAYSVGFEYRDPDFWWFGATANFFSDIYLDPAPITRTKNFYLDQDGLPFNDYDPEIARELLKQEAFDSYMVVNLIGGKSWKIDDYYIGFFASVNNLLDKVYKTGGFEQSRGANYRTLGEDFANPTRVFGPRYWYGRGTNYFLNVYFRF